MNSFYVFLNIYDLIFWFSRRKATFGSCLTELKIIYSYGLKLLDNLTYEF